MNLDKFDLSEYKDNPKPLLGMSKLHVHSKIQYQIGATELN